MGFVRKKAEQAKDAASDAVGITKDIVKPVIQTVDAVVVKPVVDTVSDIYMEVRDPLQAAAVVAGNYVVPGSAIITSQLVSDDAKQMLATDIGKAAVIGSGVAGSGLLNSTDPNAVGGVTGPDNIDVGGGWSPAAGATAAELEAARIALGTPEVVAPELTAQEVLDKIQADQASSMTAAETQAMIDAEAAEAAAVASATPEQVAAAKASGMSMLDYARAGLLVNAITGDPLGLGGGAGGMGGTGGTTGFAQVPIPAEWKSPTYAAPSAPIDLSAIFSNQNMLGGTQWQNLPTQQPNISFNDIFTAGKQQTPMGTPVDINQIVSAILGQTATSQKSS